MECRRFCRRQLAWPSPAESNRSSKLILEPPSWDLCKQSSAQQGLVSSLWRDIGWSLCLWESSSWDWPTFGAALRISSMCIASPSFGGILLTHTNATQPSSTKKTARPKATARSGQSIPKRICLVTFSPCDATTTTTTTTMCVVQLSRRAGLNAGQLLTLARSRGCPDHLDKSHR